MAELHFSNKADLWLRSFFRLRDANICLRYGVGCGMMNRK